MTLADDAVAVLRGLDGIARSVTASALADGLRFNRGTMSRSRWRSSKREGQVLRGRFTPHRPMAEIEWCNRRVLARIHRTTLGRLRREIEPVTALQFHDFLTRWQHVARRIAASRRRWPAGDHPATAGL